KHKGEIEVMSFSWGLSNTGGAASGGGGGAGKAQFQDLHFTTNTSKASPKLMLACASGQHIKKAELFCRKAGGDGTSLEFMRLTLTDTLVSSYQVGGSGGNLPADNVSLNFSKIEFQYKPQNPDGTLGSAVEAGWDVKLNRVV